MAARRITPCRGDSFCQEVHCLQGEKWPPGGSLLSGNIVDAKGITTCREIVAARRITACREDSGRQEDEFLQEM